MQINHLGRDRGVRACVRARARARPAKNPYTITVKIRKPGTSRPIEAKFDFKP